MGIMTLTAFFFLPPPLVGAQRVAAKRKGRSKGCGVVVASSARPWGHVASCSPPHDRNRTAAKAKNNKQLGYGWRAWSCRGRIASWLALAWSARPNWVWGDRTRSISTAWRKSEMVRSAWAGWIGGSVQRKQARRGTTDRGVYADYIVAYSVYQAP